MAKERVAFSRRDLGTDRTEWARILGLLGGNRTVHLATAGEDGPRVRPITTVQHEGDLYVLTGARDAKVAQLKQDPRFELSWAWTEGKSTGYIRLRGRVTFVRRRAEREAVSRTSGFVVRYWTGVDDPLLVILRLDIRAAELLPPGSTEYLLLSRVARSRRPPRGKGRSR